METLARTCRSERFRRVFLLGRKVLEKSDSVGDCGPATTLGAATVGVVGGGVWAAEVRVASRDRRGGEGSGRAAAAG